MVGGSSPSGCMYIILYAMKIKAPKKILKKNEFYILIGQDINNYVSKSRDIVKELQKFEKNVANINALVNSFRLFLLKNEINGDYADLSKFSGDIKVDFKEGNTFLYDSKVKSHSKSQKNKKGRFSIETSSRDVVFVVRRDLVEHKNKGEEFWQNLSDFARYCQEVFKGRWEVYKMEVNNNSIDIPYKVKKEQEKEVEEKGNKGIRKRRSSSLGLIDYNTMVYFLSEKIRLKLVNYYPDVEFLDDLVVSKSQNLDFGHISSNVAFKISKEVGHSPFNVAEDIAVKLGGETEFSHIFAKIEVAKNGFINFFIYDKFLMEFLTENTFNIGAHRVQLPENSNILIESPSANPNKPLHVGHLLNVCLSTSLSAIFSEIGFNVYRDNLINDKGLPIFKLVWAYQNYADKGTPDSENLDPGEFVGKYYALGNEKFEESEEVREQIYATLKKWEEGNKRIVSLWKKLMNWALEGQEKVMDRLGVDMGYLWYESDFYKEAKDLVTNSVDGENIIETEDGAIVAKIEREYGLSDVVLLRSDGTSLYHTQDIYLSVLKIEKFNPWKAIWVVGNEQIAHFQKLFSIIDMLGLLSIDNLYHLAHGFVFDKRGKKMSSRTGDTLTANELIDLVKESIIEQKEKVTDEVAEKVGVGALKYALLSSDPFKDVKFDLKQAVSFNGKSGPYVMYAYARANNILEKSGEVKFDLEDEVELTEIEREIVLKCFDYPNVVVSAANNYSPHLLAEYLYDLAKLFSQMYETESVLNAEGNRFIIKAKIVENVRDRLGRGLKLLGIEPLEKM